MSWIRPTRAPSTGFPCASFTVTWSTLSPARGGSGSRAISTRRSPTWNAQEHIGFDLLQAASSQSSTASRLVTLFMTGLVRLGQTELAADGPRQLRETLLIGGEV